MPNTNQKISVISLKSHLNGSRVEHNKQGYDDFVRYMTYKVPISTIARLFGVNIKTVKKWRVIHREESKN